MLAGRPEVSGIHCVKDAKIPLLQFTFEGILIDLPFAKLQVTAVPDVRRNNNLCFLCFYYYCNINCYLFRMSIYSTSHSQRILMRQAGQVCLEYE